VVSPRAHGGAYIPSFRDNRTDKIYHRSGFT
jgi:hypothetical protein